LWKELEYIGIIDRIKEVPQLGVIRVPKGLAKTRYDYIMLQLYLHQIIKKNLQRHLKLSYNNPVAIKEFQNGDSVLDQIITKIPTIGDVLQLLTIIYNIGHFYNTFTASRAITMLSSANDVFYNIVVSASSSERYQKAAQVLLHEKNYQRLHLLNSILILEHCDQTKQSVSLALEILYAYICESALPEDSKLKYILSIFKKIRTVSYIAYDLHVSEMPIMIDLCNEKAMKLLLQELLSEYNDNQPAVHLVQSIAKLLDDTVYYDNSDSICYYKISKKIVSQIIKDSECHKVKSYYDDLFLDKSSALNRIYVHKKDFIQDQILKLTFSKEQRTISEALFRDLESIKNIRVGYYDRHTGEQTILVSIAKSCSTSTQRYAAFKVMKCAVKYLRGLDIPTDVRFILCVKFFLFYLFDKHPVLIKQTIDRDKCVLCTRGKKSRIKALESLLKNSVGTDDENHEVKFLLSRLVVDPTNDTSITIPASILVYEKDIVDRTFCEFDGMIIHPMRKTNQVVFLEAKNRNKNQARGKNCLKKKLDKFSLQYDCDDIKIEKFDSYLKYTIRKSI
jgi:hypothetical protein